jgi:hypothetical protein
MGGAKCGVKIDLRVRQQDGKGQFGLHYGLWKSLPGESCDDTYVVPGDAFIRVPVVCNLQLRFAAAEFRNR